MNTGNPSFSLIVNTVDRARSLQTLLRSLEHQSYPRFEVIVVVGPTTDNTLEVLSEYESRIRILRCPDANLSRSRNIGLLAARGDIVVYMDDDAVPCRRYLEQLAQLFEDPNLDATGGAIYLIHPDHAHVQYRIGLISSLLEQINVRSSWLEDIVPSGMGCQWISRMSGSNMAFRRAALLEVRGFDELFAFNAEEADLISRMVNGGYTVHPVKEAVVYHIQAFRPDSEISDLIERWRIQTRSAVYYSVRNGLKAGDSLQSVALRCMHLFNGRWTLSRTLRQRGEMSLLQLWTMRFQEARSVLSGAGHALFSPRQTIDSSASEQAMADDEPILDFQEGDSKKQASVNPVSGRRPLTTLPAPPLRICLLSKNYPPEQYDGVGRLTNLMARGLFELGHTVHLVAHGERERTAFYDGAYVHRIPYRTERYGQYRWLTSLFHCLNFSHAVYETVKRLVVNEGIQLVDSSIWQFIGLVTAMSGVTPVVVRLTTGSRQVSTLQNVHTRDARLMGEMERELLTHANHVLPNTRATLKAVQKTYGIRIEEGQHTIVPYGVVPVPDEEVRPFDVEAPPDTLTVLYVGRLEQRKGILDLFEAIPEIARRVPSARFIIVGQDNSEHDGFQDRMKMDYPTYFAHRYGEFLPWVEFTGMVSDETLQSLYQSCDLLVAPSLYESFGLIYLEAMNYAKPVIGCHTGGVPEVVEQGVTGLLVDPEAPSALAEAVVSLLNSPRRLREMGIAGRQQLMDEFTYIQMAKNFARVYRTVLQTSGGDQYHR